mmetsp:Transcript_17692/g.52622  ORF Transcript_17692/g.52622 Transcript_17692/m.52622 type:complete len:276 (-) Transcript_17692:59-886(-)
MIALRVVGALAALLSAHGFQLKPAAAAPRAAPLSMLPPRPGDMSPETMKQAADALKNLSPEQISQMLNDVENMSEDEKKRLKSMGINPAMLQMSMKVMKQNPGVIKMAQEQMANMSPEQMKQASDMAQSQMESMSQEDLEKMADDAIRNVPNIPGSPVIDVDAIPAAAPASAGARGARDEALVDALFTVGAAMSKAPGKMTLAAFKALPPIASLRGELPDDLSDAEIGDAWLEAGLDPAAAADKTAFTKVWLALDQLYDDDMMDEARRPPKKSRA